MLKLYDTDHEFCAYLMAYKDLCIDTDLNTADKELTFTYLKPGVIQNEYYVETDSDRYVVKELHPSEEGTDVVCQLDLEALEADVFEKYTAVDNTIGQMANLALVGTGWTVVVESAIATLQRNVQVYQARPRQIIEKIRDAFMVEFWYDTIGKVVHFEEEIGEYKGVYLRRGLNLSKLSTSVDTYDYYTRIYPIGKDGLTIASVNQGSKYLTNFQYSNKIRTYIWEDSSYEDAQTLKDDAQAKLADLSRPKISYEVELRDLAKMSEQYSILSYSIGDTVDIVDPMVEVKDQQRIVRMSEYPDEPERNTCELSNTILTFEEIQDRLRKSADAWDDSTYANGNIKGVRVEGVEADGIVGIDVKINDDIESSEYIAGIEDRVTVNEGDISTNTTNIATNTSNISSVTARVGTLEATALTVTQANIRYADIGLAQVSTANVKNMYVRTGLIKTLIVDEQMVDFLDAVEIEADKITAGTIIADRVLLTTTDGLLYALNNLGTEQSANVDTLDGKIITPASIRAVKIDVEDLFAQDITATGTITGLEIKGTRGEVGGWTMMDRCLYAITGHGDEVITAVFQNTDIDTTYTVRRYGDNTILVEQWYSGADHICFRVDGIKSGWQIEVSGNYDHGDATLSTDVTHVSLAAQGYEQVYPDRWYNETLDKYIQVFSGYDFAYTYYGTVSQVDPTKVYHTNASDVEEYYILQGKRPVYLYQNGTYIETEDPEFEYAEEAPTHYMAGLPEGATLAPHGDTDAYFATQLYMTPDIDSSNIGLVLTLPTATAGETYVFTVTLYDENGNQVDITSVDHDGVTVDDNRKYSELIEGLPTTAVLGLKRTDQQGNVQMLFYVDKAGDMNAHTIYEGGTALEDKYVKKSELETLVRQILSNS